MRGSYTIVAWGPSHLCVFANSHIFPFLIKCSKNYLAKPNENPFKGFIRNEKNMAAFSKNSTTAVERKQLCFSNHGETL